MELKSGRRTCVVVMGPSGVGKTTTATGLADRLGWHFAEADAFHPKANIDKMSAGIPLDDADRAPWLARIRDWLSERARAGEDTVITCSALKRDYRDVLRAAEPRVRFVELVITQEIVGERMARREGHYMPPSLLGSQFATLEPLRPDEDGVRLPVEGDAADVVQSALDALDLRAS